MSTKKKSPQLVASQDEQGQAQHILEHYHQIAAALHASKERSQVETALTEINNLPEGAQLVLLKELAKETHTDAADVLTALYELSPLKNVHKEAHRSLIRLSGAKVYPIWQPPVDKTLTIDLTQPESVALSHFWKGTVTESLNVGEAQLLLCWEVAGNDKNVRIFGFLLDFYSLGVRDFFTRIESKRSFEKFAAQLAFESELTFKDCSAAEGRLLVQRALDINTRKGTRPHRDFRTHRELIDQWVLNPSSEEDGDNGQSAVVNQSLEKDFGLPEEKPVDIVIAFIESCFNGKHDIAYDLLAQESRLREGLAKEQWIEKRKDWLYQSDPQNLRPGFVSERKASKPKLWLPSLASKHRSASQKEVEVAWSVELYETPLNHALPELPEPTTVYEETQRRWYWSSFVLVQEHGQLCIQDITDEGENAQNLTKKELEKRIEELVRYAELSMEASKELEQDEQQGNSRTLLDEVITHIVHANYYMDILLKKAPFDREMYEKAASFAGTVRDFERCLVYLLALVQRFPEQRALFLRRIGEVQVTQSTVYEHGLDEERAERYRHLAEQSLKDSLNMQDSFGARMSFVDLLLEEEEIKEENNRLDEVEDHLLQAQKLATEPDEITHVEFHLGQIAAHREQFQASLHHYQRVVDLQPDSAESWYDLAEAQAKLENLEEAEADYKRAIDLDPEEETYYLSLCDLYVRHGQAEKAMALLEDSLKANPDSAVLYATMASLYLLKEDSLKAETFLRKAEHLEPDSELVQQLRFVLQQYKAKTVPGGSIASKSGNRPKKRR